MAETIIVHFSKSDISDVKRVFGEVAETGDDVWYVPSNIDYLLRIYPYQDYSREYDDSEKLVVVSHLGSEPEFSFCIELRRAQQGKACELIKNLFTIELADFNFVIDDCIDKIWTKRKIINN